MVRYGSRGKATKSGKKRRVPLIPRAVEVMTQWLERLPSYAPDNDMKLAFPTPRGCRRGKGKTPKAWQSFLDAAELGRNFRWHDLRHTCGSSLVAGWWGRAWRMEEVRDLLGHSTVRVTELYAHLAPSVLSQAAAATFHSEPMAEEESAKGAGESVADEGDAAGEELGPRSAHTHGPAISNPASFPWRAPSDSSGRPTDSKSLSTSMKHAAQHVSRHERVRGVARSDASGALTGQTQGRETRLGR